jgi:hypothetical protein
MDYSHVATPEIVSTTIAALEKNGIHASLVETREKAKDLVLESIPVGAEVMTMTSMTLVDAGITEAINESGNYNSLRNTLNNLDPVADRKQMNQLGAAPDYVIGSVHAVTQDGEVIIASNTGSQLPAYAYGAANVIWVVGTQKIVKDIDDGMKRIYEYTLPLESERANNAYGITTGSYVSKILTIKREIVKDRIKLIFVNENIGF